MAVPDELASGEIRFAADRVATNIARGVSIRSPMTDQPIGSFQDPARSLSDTRLPCARHDYRTFRMQHGRADWLACLILGNAMTTVKLRASTILTAFGDVQSELVGKAVVLTDGKAGTVESVWLDELHGLRISIRGHDGKWPISTIKMQQGRGDAGPV
jgi:hypothetical protein